MLATFRPYVGRPHPIQELVLLPSSGGRFEVTADGELIYSKAATGRHASQEEIVTLVRERLKK